MATGFLQVMVTTQTALPLENVKITVIDSASGKTLEEVLVVTHAQGSGGAQGAASGNVCENICRLDGDAVGVGHAVFYHDQLGQRDIVLLQKGGTQVAGTVGSNFNTHCNCSFLYLRNVNINVMMVAQRR